MSSDRSANSQKDTRTTATATGLTQAESFAIKTSWDELRSALDFEKLSIKYASKAYYENIQSQSEHQQCCPCYKASPG